MDVQTILTLSLPYLLPFVAALAVGLGRLLWQRMPLSQREEAARLAQVAVQAAEQSMPDAAGPDKKAAVEADLKAIFKASHLNVPPALVNIFIESAVATMNADKPAPPSGGQVGFTPPVVLPAGL